MIKAKVLYFPRSEEVKYKTSLLKLVYFIEKEVKRLIYPVLNNHYKRQDSLNYDGFIEDIELLLVDIKELSDAEVLVMIGSLSYRAKKIREFVTKGVINSLKGLLSVKTEPVIGVDIFKSIGNESLDEIARSWAVTNSRLIKSIPETMLNDVSFIIQTGFREGTGIYDLKNQIQTKFGVAENRAKLIARDQVAKLNSNYIRDEHAKLGITQYEWVTSDDERVRESHKVMNGKICQWDSDLTYKNMPNDSQVRHRSSIRGVEKQFGEDFQCRCTCRAIID